MKQERRCFRHRPRSKGNSSWNLEENVSHQPPPVNEGSAEAGADRPHDSALIVEPGKLNRLDLDRIIATPPPPIPWAIRPWFVRGDIICLAGEPKLGKSWVGLDLAVALASDGRFLGALQVEGGPYRVLVVDEENNPVLLDHRVHRHRVGLGIAPENYPSSRLRFLVQNALNLDLPHRREALVPEIEDFRPDLIIFDSMIRFHSRDENSNTEMSAFHSKVIQPLKVLYKTGILQIHHLAKPGQGSASLFQRIRGASDITAAVDQVWGLTGDRQGTRSLVHVATRSGESAPDLSFTIEDVEEGSGLVLVAQDQELNSAAVLRSFLSERSSTGALRQEVIEHLKEKGSKAPDRLATKFLGRLNHNGVAKRRSEGKEARYWLSDHAPHDAV